VALTHLAFAGLPQANPSRPDARMLLVQDCQRVRAHLPRSVKDQCVDPLGDFSYENESYLF